MDVLLTPTTKRIKTDNFDIKAVLSDEFKKEITLIKAYSCCLERQQLEHSLKELTTKLPHFQHLKRVHDSNVLICPTKDIQHTLEQHLQQHNITEEVLQTLCKNVKEVEVPASWPRLRVQYEKMLPYWPVKFHPNKYMESLHNGTNFSSAEGQFHRRMAQLLRSLSSDLNEDGNMGICVDPRGSSIVAIAGSQPEALPHEHCVMWLVDHVARSQGGGAWESTQKFSSEPTELGVPQSYKDYIQQQQDFQDLQIGAELPRNCQSLQELEQEQSAANNLSKYGPYLCTGYDVYLLREPCLMCAMALVHSRVRRIFFLDCCKNGALISCFKLHTIKELNHHYEVFHIILT